MPTAVDKQYFIYCHVYKLLMVQTKKYFFMIWEEKVGVVVLELAVTQGPRVDVHRNNVFTSCGELEKNACNHIFMWEGRCFLPSAGGDVDSI